MQKLPQPIVRQGRAEQITSWADGEQTSSRSRGRSHALAVFVELVDQLSDQLRQTRREIAELRHELAQERHAGAARAVRDAFERLQRGRTRFCLDVDTEKVMSTSAPNARVFRAVNFQSLARADERIPHDFPHDPRGSTKNAIGACLCLFGREESERGSRPCQDSAGEGGALSSHNRRSLPT